MQMRIVYPACNYVDKPTLQLNRDPLVPATVSDLSVLSLTIVVEEKGNKAMLRHERHITCTCAVEVQQVYSLRPWTAQVIKIEKLASIKWLHDGRTQ
jgi:hypothetical protein